MRGISGRSKGGAQVTEDEAASDPKSHKRIKAPRRCILRGVKAAILKGMASYISSYSAFVTI